MGETRKLAAILVADAVGNSRLAGADEERTLARHGLIWGGWCQGLFLPGISLFDRPATSPRPDLISVRARRGAAVKGGRRPSRSDLPLTAVSKAPSWLGRATGRVVSLLSFLINPATIPRGARHRAHKSRAANLYSVDLDGRTMMQSCASAAKLRRAGPF